MQFNENIPKPQNLVFYPTFLKKPALILPKDDPSSNILSPLKSNPSELSPIRKPLKEISVKVPLSSSHRNQGSQIQSHLLDTTHEIQVITESHQICNELDLSVPSESSTQANESLINDNHLLIEKLNVQISDLKMELDKVKQSANQFQQQTSSLDKLLRDRDLQIRELIEENKTLASQVQGNQKRLGDALDRRESLMEKLNKEQESRASALGEVETWRREFYHAMAMAVKLCNVNMGNPSNLSVQDLVEEALHKNIPAQDYPEFLASKFRTQQAQIRVKKRTVEKKPKKKM